MPVRSLLRVFLVGLWLWPAAAYGQSPELRDASNRSKDLSAHGRYQGTLPFVQKAVRLSNTSRRVLVIRQSEGVRQRCPL